MADISKSVYITAIVDALIIVFTTMYTFAGFTNNALQLFIITLWFLAVLLISLFFKGFYQDKKYRLTDIYLLFEAVSAAAVITAIPLLIAGFSIIAFLLLAINAAGAFACLLLWRIINLLSKNFKSVKNVLIVGAGQDGKLIAEEIQARPELGMRVVGFLDDNMNNIEDEDSTIPILGLTCDSEAVIKDNNVKIVIIAVKSRMDSVILTDLVKGIPLGVKVWRIPKFYEKITHKYLVSKMTVNWLFYDCVRKKALLYANIKRFCDIVASILILILTSAL